MQLRDNPTLASIRETRHKISEEFGHDPQRIVEYYRELQKKEEEQRSALDVRGIDLNVSTPEIIEIVREGRAR